MAHLNAVCAIACLSPTGLPAINCSLTTAQSSEGSLLQSLCLLAQLFIPSLGASWCLWCCSWAAKALLVAHGRIPLSANFEFWHNAISSGGRGALPPGLKRVEIDWVGWAARFKAHWTMLKEQPPPFRVRADAFCCLSTQGSRRSLSEAHQPVQPPEHAVEHAHRTISCFLMKVRHVCFMNFRLAAITHVTLGCHNLRLCPADHSPDAELDLPVHQCRSIKAADKLQHLCMPKQMTLLVL